MSTPGHRSSTRALLQTSRAPERRHELQDWMSNRTKLPRSKASLPTTAHDQGALLLVVRGNDFDKLPEVLLGVPARAMDHDDHLLHCLGAGRVAREHRLEGVGRSKRHSIRLRLMVPR
eukprot:CAMPEP_0115409046 /NCGR_PEP_ID=MMETSP0271-20121206/19804_1 /TAXON_ID=71861 /ORGANISM="Scrippsiella trochoidea, Strain CCMP3099" /LENGTH=117 /DNA_ID=CAMNT_0002833185 /DNA_START=322 /DNA_END=672 /DNA_ORIENTATION=+